MRAITTRKPRFLDTHANFDATVFTSLIRLEPEVLERFCSAPIERRSGPILTAPLRQIALGDPSSSSMRSGRQLCKRVLRLAECRFGLVETVLLEQRATEHQARVADLVQPVCARDRRLTAAEA